MKEITIKMYESEIKWIADAVMSWHQSIGKHHELWMSGLSYAEACERVKDEPREKNFLECAAFVFKGVSGRDKIILRSVLQAYGYDIESSEMITLDGENYMVFQSDMPLEVYCQMARVGKEWIKSMDEEELFNI